MDDLQHVEQLRTSPSRYGNPILYPWPSRIPNDEYTFQGQSYLAKEPGADGSSSHGLVKNRPWRLLDIACSEHSASLAGSISTHDHPDMLRSFPFPNELTVTYRITATKLTIDASVRNLGDRLMPFGLGFHPYFTVPLGTEGSRQDCWFELEAGTQWDFDAIHEVRGGVATSSPIFQPTNEPPRTILGRDDYNLGYSKLARHGNSVRARLCDPAAQVAAAVEASAGFNTWVVYSPPGRNALCLEPWTCTANAFNLHEAGYENSGLILLEPGGSWQGAIVIGLQGL